jgi:uncharacterized protein YndB with AHSA1/START domain
MECEMAYESTCLLGTLRADGDRGVLRIEDRFDSSIEDVWDALTEPARLAKWIGKVEGDFHVGGLYRRSFFGSGSEGTGRIEACQPPRRLIVRHFSESADEHLIEVTLMGDGDETTVVVEASELPKEKLFAYGAGIQIHVEDLGAHLAGRQVAEADPRWDELLPRYEELARQSGIGS